MQAPIPAVHSVIPDDIRVILCLAFDPRAAPAEVAAFKGGLIAFPCIVHALESSGSFDFMVEASLPDLAAYHEWLTSLAEPLARLVKRFEANFVCNRYIRGHKADHAIWVPNDEGMRRIDHSAIDKVKAEGDYVRVYSRDQSWLLHATLHSLAETLDPSDFIQVHRSSIVRSDFIDCLIHRGSRWIARLNDGTHERIAKSRVATAVNRTRRHPSMPEASSSNAPQFVEPANII